MPTPTDKRPLLPARWQIVSPGRLRPTLFAGRKYWAHRFGVAPISPMSRAEMELLGWECCDVILVTGDAYVDHPSFGAALIGRLLEEQGFRVGIIAQPNWRSATAFACLGRPALMFGVTAGNMDSMVNLFTAEKRVRSDDAYSPDARPGLRPERAVTVYAQRCREAFSDVPVVIGGIEASLRRVAHYDYWSDKVRRSVLFDSKADLLVYGNGERQVVEIAHRLAAGEPVATIADVRGTALALAAKARHPGSRLTAPTEAPRARPTARSSACPVSRQWPRTRFSTRTPRASSISNPTRATRAPCCNGMAAATCGSIRQLCRSPQQSWMPSTTCHSRAGRTRATAGLASRRMR